MWSCTTWVCQYFPDLQDINLGVPDENQGNYQRELWDQEAADLCYLQVNNQGRANTLGKTLWDFIMNYFVNAQGAIPFQDRTIQDIIH